MMSKTISMEKELGGLSPEAREQFAAQFNEEIKCQVIYIIIQI